MKIENPAAGQGLALGSYPLVLNGGGLLVTGSNAFTISDDGGVTTLTGGSSGIGVYELVVNQYNSGGLTISAGIGDNGTHATALTMTGPGTLTLGGSNTYSGATTVIAGTLVLTNSAALLNSTFNGGAGALNFGGGLTAATLGGLGGSSNLDLDNATPQAVALTVGNNGASTTYSGVLSGSGSLIKIGTRALTLSGSNNTYSGGTTLNAGMLVVCNGTNGSATGTNTVTLNGGTMAVGTLSIGTSATAQIFGLVQAGSGPHTIPPGAGLTSGYGTLYLNGGLSTNAYTTLAFNLNLGNPIGGSTYGGDLIVIGAGGLSIGQSTAISFASNPSNFGEYRLLSGNIGSPTLANFLLPTAPSGDTYTLSTTADTGYLDLVVSPLITTPTTYSLSASASPGTIHVSGSTTVTASITNAGAGNADLLNFTNLTLNASGGTLSGGGLPISGGSLAQGLSNSGSQTFASNTAGIFTLSSTVGSATNATIGGAASAGTLTTAAVNVFSGSGTWTSSSGSLWSASGNWTDANGVQAAPGTFAGFANTDTATFNGSGAVTSISLSGANPSLAALGLSGSNYSLTSGTLTLSSTGMATVTVSGTQSIGSVVSLASTADMVVTNTADRLTISGPIVGGSPLLKDGARHADPQRQQHLFRQHAHQRRHARLGQPLGPAKQHPRYQRQRVPELRIADRGHLWRPHQHRQPCLGQLRQRGCGPGRGQQRRQYDVLGRDQRQRQPDQDRHGNAEPGRQQHL